MFRTKTKVRPPGFEHVTAYCRVMTKYDVPRDDDGFRLCEHCQIKRVPESLGTKPRRYCSRNCRQRAYEARKTGRAIREAVAVESRRRTSRDKEEQKTRDVPGLTSGDEQKDTTPPAPGFPLGLGLTPVRRGGRRRATATASAMPLPFEEPEDET